MKYLTAILLIFFSLYHPVQADTSFPPSLFGGPFELVDGTGETVRDTDFRGQFMLIYFGYTYCPDICPGDLSRLALALDGLPQDALNRVQPIFVTVDPERDTPDMVGDYASAFHPRLIGLSGSDTAIKQAVTAYRVHRAKVYLPDAPKEEYLVSHSPTLYLMGPDGAFLTLFPHDSDPAAMTAAILRYLQDR